MDDNSIEICYNYGQINWRGLRTIQKIADIDLAKYSCISSQIRSSTLVLTEKQKQHIIERRTQEFFDTYSPYFREIAEDPDYIFRDDKHENSAIASKTLQVDGKHINLAIRLAITGDDEKLENSIITAIIENDKRYAQRLRNKEPLYRKK